MDFQKINLNNASGKPYRDAYVHGILDLIAPRALYIENGEADELFPIESVRAEASRLRPFYAAANAQDKLLLHIGDNGHSVCVGEKGFSFFVDNLL